MRDIPKLFKINECVCIKYDDYIYAYMYILVCVYSLLKD